MIANTIHMEDSLFAGSVVYDNIVITEFHDTITVDFIESNDFGRITRSDMFSILKLFQVSENSKIFIDLANNRISFKKKIVKMFLSALGENGYHDDKIDCMYMMYIMLS